MDTPTCDTHIHTIYCGHADESMLVHNILAAAADKGLRTIAITEHLHYPQHRARIDRILADLARLEVPCEVYVGAEVDASGFAEDGSLVAGTDGLAYVIGSTHHYPGGRHWWYDKPELGKDERVEMVDRWFAWADQVIANPKVDTFAHPGVFLSASGLAQEFSGAVLDSFRGLFATAAQHGTLIELNELAARKLSDGCKESYPALIRAAVDAGCKIVIGSDAHQPEAVARFDWVLKVADAAGLTAADLAVPPWHCAPARVPGDGA